MHLCASGLQFLDIVGLEGTERVEPQDADVFSKPIYFRDGIPVGIDTQTESYVSNVLANNVHASLLLAL